MDTSGLQRHDRHVAGGYAVRIETVAFKHLLRKKTSMVLLLSGITVSVLITVSLSSLVDALGTKINDEFDEIGPNLVVRPAGIDRSISYGPTVIRGGGSPSYLTSDDYLSINTIENRDNIATVAPKILQEVSSEGEEFILAGVYFQFEKQIKKWWSLEGEWPFREDEIMIGSRLADAAGLRVGDSMKIEEKNFKITSVLAPQQTEEDYMAFASILTVQELFDRANQISFIEVAAYCTSCPLPIIAEQIRGKIADAEVFVMQDVVAARTATVERFASFAAVISTVVVLVGVGLVSLLLIASVHSRTGEIGMLRSMGYRRSHISELILTEASIVGVIGGFLGFVIGVLISKAIGPRFDLSSSDIVWNFFQGSVVVLSATVIAVLSGVLPAILASRFDPVQSIKHQ